MIAYYHVKLGWQIISALAYKRAMNISYGIYGEPELQIRRSIENFHLAI